MPGTLEIRGIRSLTRVNDAFETARSGGDHAVKADLARSSLTTAASLSTIPVFLVAVYFIILIILGVGGEPFAEMQLPVDWSLQRQ
jgi:hypothetical protein